MIYWRVYLTASKICVLDMLWNHLIWVFSFYVSPIPGLDKMKEIVQITFSLAFVSGIHQWPVDSRHKGPVTRKMFPLDDVSWYLLMFSLRYYWSTYRYPPGQLPHWHWGQIKSNQIKWSLLSYWDKVRYTAITNSTHCHMSHNKNHVWHNTKYRPRITKQECSDLTQRHVI